MNIFQLLIILFLFRPEPMADTSSEHLVRIPNHSIWSAELNKYVSHDGLVDYKDWKENQDQLDQYLTEISGELPLSRWSQNVQLAYWLNLYNAYSFKQVLEYYPVASMRNVNDGDLRKKQWIPLDTASFSLEQIQQHIQFHFKDPRVYFALHYAAVSGCPLLNEAYEPHLVQDQLDNQVRQFISNTHHNVIQDSLVILSPVFEWYASEFRPDIISFLNDYLENPLPKDIEIRFGDFDWALDAQPEEVLSK